jgi:hypothetical protein
MIDPRLRELLTQADAEQQTRARLYLMLTFLTDPCDTRAFCDVLADVATLRADLGRLTAEDRERWRQLAAAAHACAAADAPPALRRSA